MSRRHVCFLGAQPWLAVGLAVADDPPRVVVALVMGVAWFVAGMLLPEVDDG